MSVSLESLEQLAGDVLDRVPQEVTNGAEPASLYGLGFLGRFALEDLKRSGLALNACYDGNPDLAGAVVNGATIKDSSGIEGDKPNFVFISARHAIKPISERLTKASIRHVSVDAYYVARDFQAFRAVHDTVLGDARSRDVLRAVMATMLTGDRRHVIEVYEKDQYFCLPHFSGIEKETYVDAGAYVGDSLERFIWAQYGVFRRAICFEPGIRQFRSLANRRKRLVTEWALDEDQIALVPAALGEVSATAGARSSNGDMTSLALAQHAPSGSEQVRVESLDAYLAGEAVSFIKADVEGMEMPLLRGAAETIRTFRPKLAICVYHYPSDIPVISQYLKSIAPDYRFALRHHSPQFMETVLYAWIDD